AAVRLSRKLVVAEARALVDEEGLDALTTRRLGERLGVQGPALYRHFKNKQELVNALGQTFFVGRPFPSLEDKWQDWLETQARTTRRAVLSCRDGARIITAAKPDLSGRMDKLLAPLLRAGFDTREALLASHLVGRLVLGWTASEQEFGGRIPPFSADLEPEAAFEFALKCVIAGLEMHLIAKKMSAGSR
ncbi:MAG: TetR family transcriptional regulator, partial [Steroidobacteraceae bacterium]